MSKHTPGPWKLENEDTFCIISEFGTVARVEGCAYPDDETLPNARLIAAAPELLEACRAVMKYFGQCRDSSLPPGEGNLDGILVTIVEDPSTVTECIDKARAALAKAESE